MNQSDVYYRALLAYRREVGAHRACVKSTRLYAEADGRGCITLKRALCTVDEAWIRAIEEGLVHIEKAIKEERQFIYSNGEVVPIEKVKNISKDSVQHLARHAELITRAQEGEDLIPDSLYTVERLSDYAVYENRFLYMLLCYLRDFVTLRYRSILELTNRYEGTLSVEREVKSLNRQVHIAMELEEVRRDDPYLREHNPVRSLIERMDLILKTITAFLATPLMESAGKVAMLKPPITKTNVLKMDNNFKGAVALYDYIIAYDGPGYTVEEQETRLDPFRDALAEEMAEAECLLSFLTYRYGLDLTDELKAAYEWEEARRREAELKLKTEQMEAIRRRLAAEGQPQEAYILHLEKHIRALQNEVDRMPGLVEELEQHEANERRLTEEVQSLTRRLEHLEEAFREAELAHVEQMRQTVADYEQKIQVLCEAHTAELARLTEQHEAEMNALRAEQEAALTALRTEHEEETAALRASHEAELAAAEAAHTATVTAMKETHEAELAALRTEQETRISSMTDAYTAETDGLRATLAATQAALAESTDENRALTDEKRHLHAQVISLRSSQQDISDEEMAAMTQEENFDELERELEAFIRFYESQWSLTKRTIRKNLLNLNAIKKQIGMK